MGKLLIDTDGGPGGCAAVLLAHGAPDTEVAAVTTCAGACTLDGATGAALGLCGLAGLDARIAAGRDRPLIAPPAPPAGEADAVRALFPPARREADGAPAWDVIDREAAGGGLTVLALGPLGNLATALLKYEDLPGRLERVVIMDGPGAAGGGIARDPHACEIVLRCGAPVVMLGQGAAASARLTAGEWERLTAPSTPASRALRGLLAACPRGEDGGGPVPLGAAAAAAAIDPACCKAVSRHVTIELTASSPMYGRAIPDVRVFSDAERNVEIVECIDRARLAELLEHLGRGGK